MARPRAWGVCRLCGCEGDLSEEHVPPRSAFNKVRLVEQQIDTWMRDHRWSQKGKIQQGGHRVPTLCEKCNNITGHWYGPEYAAWAKIGVEWLEQVPVKAIAQVAVQNHYPLRFIKQVVTMMFSVNGPKFHQHHPELVRFILNRESHPIPADYEVYLTLFRGPNTRFIGSAARANFNTGRTVMMSEAAFPPFACVMTTGNPLEHDLGRITHFAQSGYDEKREVTFTFQRGSVFTPYPSDYRSDGELDA